MNTVSIRIAGMILLLAMLAGCGGATPTLEPTVDSAPTVQAIQTQAAQTVVADLTLNAPTEAPATATATQAPPTETALPTATATTAVILPSATATRVIPTTAPFTATPANSPTPSSIACQITEQSPAFGDDHPKNGDFDGRWVIKNTGTQAWSAAQTDIRFVSGTKFQVTGDTFDLGADVPAGGSFTFIVDMLSPNTSGRHSATWVVAQGSTVLCALNVTIDVLD